MAKHVDSAYIAGLFDGEGCVTIGKTTRRRGVSPSPTYTLRCLVGMTNAYIPQLLELRYGGFTRRTKKDDRKPVWTWAISGKLAADFLNTLLPYLRLKRNEALLGIEFQDNLDNTNMFGRNGLSQPVLALREAQKILMSKMKDKSKYEVHYE